MKKYKRTIKRRFRRGFTLAEAILATALLSMAAAGVLIPFAGGANVQAEGINRSAASSLATDLLQIIEAADYADIVSTYNGYSETAGNMKNSAGQTISDVGYSKFSRQVTCQNVFVSQQSGIGNENYILVKITVMYNSSELLTLKKLLSE